MMAASNLKRYDYWRILFTRRRKPFHFRFRARLRELELYFFAFRFGREGDIYAEFQLR